MQKDEGKRRNMKEKQKKSTLKKVRGITAHTIKWELIILGILLIGKKSFDTTYEQTEERIEMEHAKKDYQEFLDKLENLSFEEGNLSKRIYQKTGILVEEDAFYQKVNEELVLLKTKEEVEEFVCSYLPEYISRKSKEMKKERFTFYSNAIYYEDEKLKLDADSLEVLGAILESLVESKKDMSEEEEDEWMRNMLKQLVASELYEVDTCSSKKLVLSPNTRELE